MTPIEYITGCISFGTPPNNGVASIKDDEWENIAVIAIALGLAPLLHWHLSQTDISLPPLAIAKLAVTRKAHAKRNRAIGEQLAEILAACAAEDIKALVLKGALLAPTVYPEPALRPMNDIDLLFRSEDLARVGPLLERLGYEGKYKDAAHGPGVVKHISSYRRRGNDGQTPNPYLSAHGDRMVEPHGSLEETWFGLKADITPGVWERAIPVTLHNQPAYRLSNADILLHLTVHAAYHVIMGASIFVQLYDISQVVRAWRHEIDWSQVLTLAKKAQAEPFVYAGFYWAKMSYKIPLPDELLMQLAQASPPNLVSYIQGLDAAALLARTQNPPLITLQQRLWRGLLDRRETARWASSLMEKWRIWQTALTFYKTDTAALLKEKLK